MLIGGFSIRINDSSEVAYFFIRPPCT